MVLLVKVPEAEVVVEGEVDLLMKGLLLVEGDRDSVLEGVTEDVPLGLRDELGDTD